MKHFTLSLFLVLSSSFLFAQIHTVDNSNDGADFNNIPDAIAAASDGDTIYVAGSNADYGNISVNKRLAIFGSGYLSDDSSRPTKLGTVTMTNNSKKSHLSGFRVLQINATSSSTSIDSLTFTDNHITNGMNLWYRQGHIVEGNLFSRVNATCLQAWQGSSGTYATELKIRNNIFYGSVERVNDANSEIVNNTFIKTGNVNPLHNCANSTLVNNIYFGYSESDVTAGCSSCISEFAYHYYHDGTDFVGDNPMFVDPTTLSTDNITPFDINHDLSLQSGSTAIGGGQFGFDQGAYGGGSPFVKGGFPPVPRVLSITSPVSSVESGGTLEITIQAISQQ